MNIESLKMRVIASVLICMAVKITYAYLTTPISTAGPSLTELFQLNQTDSEESHTERASNLLNGRMFNSFNNLSPELLPTVFIGILVRNKAHTLPYFLHGLQKQHYPAERIQLAFILDNCVDESLDILQKWKTTLEDNYHHISLDVRSDKESVKFGKMWSKEHFDHVIGLRQDLLAAARRSWADFYLSIDADVILINPLTIRHLMEVSLLPSKFQHDMNEPIIPVLAPMLNCTSSEFYSNFWGAMTQRGYYKRSDNYFNILHRHLTGLHKVPMLHTMLLINLRHRLTQKLTYRLNDSQYDEPVDDIIMFARSAQINGVDFYLDNTQFYGYIISPVEEETLDSSKDILQQWLLHDREMFVHLRMQAVIDGVRVNASSELKGFSESMLPKPSKLGFDEIYLINLERRQDRRSMMEYFFTQLGIDARRVPAIDGQQLTTDLLNDLGIVQLEGYEDPYHKRPLKYGEVGCFLSHYALWQEMIELGHQTILVLEDDVRFSSHFVRLLQEAIFEADQSVPNWELLYIGRKRMSKDEKRVAGTRLLAHPGYTYWTLGYVIKRSGAKKLLAQNPLRKMVAVDEFLPIMFDKHPNEQWLKKFEPRNLVAYSTEPLLIEPQHYTGEPNYVSDTENSVITNVSMN